MINKACLKYSPTPKKIKKPRFLDKIFQNIVLNNSSFEKRGARAKHYTHTHTHKFIPAAFLHVEYMLELYHQVTEYEPMKYYYITIFL
jgi:hypothetical protein